MLDEEAIFCSSRKRTSRLCWRENTGDCSSELVLEMLEDDSGTGESKRETLSCRL